MFRTSRWMMFEKVRPRDIRAKKRRLMQTRKKFNLYGAEQQFTKSMGGGSRVDHVEKERRRISESIEPDPKLIRAGDDMALSESKGWGGDYRHHLANQGFNRSSDEAAAPYSKLMSRKLATGSLWPVLGKPGYERTATPKQLPHEENMSPGERKFAADIEFWLRRDFKSIPGHLSDHLDFSQVTIDKVWVRRKQEEIYISWTCADPGMKNEIEPYISQLASWVKKKIIKRMPRQVIFVPNRVFFVYNSGAMSTELPKSLVRAYKAAKATAASTIDDRLENIEQMDSLGHRMQGVPWFMPYIWSKDKQLTKTRQMQDDLATVESRIPEDQRITRIKPLTRQEKRWPGMENRARAASTPQQQQEARSSFYTRFVQ